MRASYIVDVLLEVNFKDICGTAAAVQCLRGGQKFKDIAKSAKVGDATVRRWVRKAGFRKKGDQWRHVSEADEPDAEEVKRYLELVKAKPHLRRFTREELRRYLATRPPAQPEPPSEPHQIVGEALEEGIEQDLLAASKRIKHCGDYGCLYYHPGKHEVHWTAGDSDGPPEGTSTDEIQKLLKLPGIKHVEIGDEWSPDEDEGWKRLNEAEEAPLDPQDTRSEIDRLLPTKTYTLAGNSMIHAPGVIRMAQNEWRNGRKKQKTWAMNVVHAWQGLPEEVYQAILNGKVEIETQGDSAVITVKQY